MKVLTARYFDPRVRDAVSDGFIACGITRGLPKGKLSFEWKPFQSVAPTWPMLKADLDEDAFARMYEARLDKIGFEAVRDTLESMVVTSGAKGVVLLCYENVNESWCHRRMFAKWWEKNTGEEVQELDFIDREDLETT